MFCRVGKADLRLKPSKCFLFRKEVDFLGHVVTKDGVGTDPAKIAKVAEWPRPNSVAAVRSFLGFCQYYRRFIEGYAALVAPLNYLTRRNCPFKWTQECEDAFTNVKNRLITSPILAYPRFGPLESPFILDVDASGVGLGAVLSQVQESLERPIAYASRLLADAELNYASTKAELCALVWAIRKFRCYLLGQKFIVRTDHRSLQHLAGFKEPSAIIMRWLEFLSEFDFDVVYRAGKSHGNADGMSRQGTFTPLVVGAVATELPAPFVQRRNWTMADWAEAQGKDPDLLLVRKFMASSDPTPELIGVSRDVRSYWRGRQQLLMVEGVICRRWVDPQPGKPGHEQIIVPRQMRSSVLTEFHDNGGHTGISRLHAQLLQRFHWYGMRRDVEDWVSSCVSCSQRRKPVGRGQGAPLSVTWSGYPFERIAMDLIPNLPETLSGNRHILVIVDYFTKWVEAYPLQKMDAGTIASVFVSGFVSRFGAPENLHTDQGKNFDSNLFKEVCSLLGVHKTRTTAYHPASDGLVERFNQTLEKTLAAYVSDHHRDWDVSLPAVLMAYRATPQSSTGYTPSYLLFGREMCLPQDVAYGLPSGEAKQPSQHVKELRQRMEEAHAFVRERLQKVHQHQAHLHGAKAVPISFEIGDLVWLFIPAIPVGTSRKFAKLWQGPFKVLERLSEVTYRVQDTRQSQRIQVVHVNRLKECKTRPERLMEGTSDQSQYEMTQPMRNSVAQSSASGYTPDATDQLYQEDDTLSEQHHGPDTPVIAQPQPRQQRPRRLPGWHRDYVF